MDTRGRPNDRGPARRGNQSTTPGAGPATDETAGLELVEISSVGRTGTTRGPTALILGFAGAIVAVAGLAFVPRNTVPAATTLPSAIAASTAITETDPPPPTPRRSVAPRPTSGPTPTPRPTPTHAPWEWDRTGLDVEGVELMGAWVVGDHFILHGEVGTSGSSPGQVFLTSANGRFWEQWDVPRAVTHLRAGRVLDGRLWFAGHVLEGLTESSWQLLSTSDGGEWEALPPSEQLPLGDGILELVRAGGTWAMSVWDYIPDVDGAPARHHLWTSRDGVRWTEVDLPASNATAFTFLDTMGDSIVLFGASHSQTQLDGYSLVSHDGRTWETAEFTLPVELEVHDMSCQESGCIVAGGSFFGPPGEVPGAWTRHSSDGLEWIEHPIEGFQPGIARYLRDVQPVVGGYLGSSTMPGEVWLSQDGIDWRTISVLPPGQLQDLDRLLVVDDHVLGLTFDFGVLDIWHGSLEQMGVSGR